MPFSPLDLLARWDGGANTRQLGDEIQRNESPYPLNVQFEGKKVSKAPGFTILGTEVDSTLIGSNLYSHRILSTEELLTKVIGTKLKYYNETDGAWQLLSSTAYTTGRKWWFSSFNGYLYGGNDTDSPIRIKLSSWGALSSGSAIGAVTLDLGSGEGARFAATGSGLIDGDTFAWTGVSGDQLTGVTGLLAIHAAGARVTPEPTAYASNPKGKIGVFFRNRNYVVSASSPNFLYFSKLADNTAPEDDLVNYAVSGSGAGDAGYIITDAPILDMQVFITGTNDPVLVVFCGNGIAYAASVTDSGTTTVGSVVPFKVCKEDIAGVGMSAVTENDLIFIGKSGAWRAMGYGESSSTLKSTRLADEIMPTVSEIDWSDGNAIYFDRRLFVTGKKDGASENNFVVVKDTNPNGFLFWDYLSANAFCEWKDDLYFLSSTDGLVHKMFSGRSANDKVFRSSFPTPYIDFGAPMFLKLLSRIRLAGEVSEGCTLDVKVYFDNVLIETFQISGSNTNLVAASSGVSVGSVVFGTGASRSSDSGSPIRKRFVAEWNMRAYKYFYSCCLVYENSGKDVDFLLDKQLLFGEVESADSTFTRHIL